MNQKVQFSTSKYLSAFNFEIRLYFYMNILLLSTNSSTKNVFPQSNLKHLVYIETKMHIALSLLHLSYVTRKHRPTSPYEISNVQGGKFVGFWALCCGLARILPVGLFKTVE